ncbi:MAG: hypothetical protein D6717_00320 [Gammaproteobacteria bacterium]|nr:MAG: hypothetical protein D6717_00320 [Gammaproteobacteria bacterium]
MAIKVFVEPKNGLCLPKVGHVKHGEQTVDLTEADLKGCEGVKIVRAQGGGKAQGARPQGEDELLAEIRRAVEALDKDDPEAWTSGGKPQVAAIEAVLGYQISAAERDKALA